MITGNVGDQLIIESCKNLIREIKGDVKFLEFFRKEDLAKHLEKINDTRAILMPHFGLRDPEMHPRTYHLTKDLNDIKIPLIPIGIGWKGFPGDFETLNTLRYSDSTLNFLKFVSKQISIMVCREYFTCKILENHGIINTEMGGDCAWYDFDSFGKEMKRPKKIQKLVFTTPSNRLYCDQAKKVIKMLSDLFPNAQKICSMHHGIGYIKSDRTISDFAQKQGFEVKDVSGDIKKIEFYKNCDLHVGYRCHGHIYFFRNRIPSILLHEDGRGVGFSYSFGVGGFDAFQRQSNRLLKTQRIFPLKFLNEQVVADMKVPDKIRAFIVEEIESGFKRYLGLPKIIEETYFQKMKPFLEKIP